MEFKRFYDFYTNENDTQFHTYLPIQLDATCNGFQHMALLSDEVSLFKNLNLVTNSESKGKSKNSIPASDFYSFLLHKLINYFKEKLDGGEILDSKGKGTVKGSLERLFKFVWNRTHI